MVKRDVYLPPLVVQPFLKVPQPRPPEITGCLGEEGRQMSFIYLLDVWMTALTKHLPDILIWQLPGGKAFPAVKTYDGKMHEVCRGILRACWTEVGSKPAKS